MTGTIALLLTPVRPCADGNGLARRAWAWAAELSAGHDLHTIIVAGDHRAIRGDGRLPGRHCVLWTNRRGIRGRAAADWIEPDTDLIAALIALLPRQAPDRVVVFRAYLAGVAAALPAEWAARAEIDFDDDEVRTRLSIAHLELRQGRWRQALNALRAARFFSSLQRELCAGTRTLTLAAEEDAIRWRRLHPRATVVARPNRITGPIPPVTSQPTAPTLLFVGSMGYKPNQDAAVFLAEQIAPLLRQEVPGLRVVVAGFGMAPMLTRLRAAGVECLDSPDDLAGIYANASVVVAPVRAGGGTKIKVLEAWLHHRPVVATSHAVRGLAAEPGRHLLVADSAAELAQACRQLLTDPDLAAAIATAGHAHLCTHFLLPPPPEIAPLAPFTVPPIAADAIAPDFAAQPPDGAPPPSPLVARHALTSAQATLSDVIAQRDRALADASMVRGTRAWRLAERVHDVINRNRWMLALLRQVARQPPSVGPGSSSIRAVLDSGVFDADWYRAENPDIGTEHPVLHYLRVGRLRLRPTSAVALQRTGQARSLALGQNLTLAPVRLVIGLAGAADRQQCQRVVRSALLSAELAGVEPEILCPAQWGEAAPDGVRQISAAGTPAAQHNAMLQAAGEEALYLAVDARGFFDPDCITALLRMSQAAGHRALIEATAFPREHPRQIDPSNFDTAWAGGGCLLIPAALANHLGGCEAGLEALWPVDLSWRARQAGFAVKSCPTALYHTGGADQDWRWIDAETLRDGYRLATLWQHHAAAAALRAEILRSDAAVFEPVSAITNRDPACADFAHGFGFAPSRW
jgi:glycosyltransferase involved in cell wall biosynthesis